MTRHRRDVIELLENLLAMLTSVDARLRDDDQPHYTHVKTLTVPPDHVTHVRGANGEIMAYKVRIRT